VYHSIVPLPDAVNNAGSPAQTVRSDTAGVISVSGITVTVAVAEPVQPLVVPATV